MYWNVRQTMLTLSYGVNLKSTTGALIQRMSQDKAGQKFSLKWLHELAQGFKYPSPWAGSSSWPNPFPGRMECSVPPGSLFTMPPIFSKLHANHFWIQLSHQALLPDLRADVTGWHTVWERSVGFMHAISQSKQVYH